MVQLSQVMSESRWKAFEINLMHERERLIDINNLMTQVSNPLDCVKMCLHKVIIRSKIDVVVFLKLALNSLPRKGQTF